MGNTKNNSKRAGRFFIEKNLEDLLHVTSWFKKYFWWICLLLFIVAFILKVIIYHFGDSRLPISESLALAFVKLFTGTVIALLSIAAIGVIYMLTKNLLLTIAGAHAEKNNEEAEVADSVKATESEGGLDEFPTASELQYDPLRAMLRDDFCGPDDCIYKQLRKDLAEILTNPDVRGTTTRIGEIAYKLYMPTKGETAKLVDKEYMLVFGKWLPKFCDIIGIETPKDTRQSKYEEFHEVNGLPMRYLFASSFDDFKDPVLVKKYLRD